MVLALVLAMIGRGQAPTGSILDAPGTAPGTLVPGTLVPGAPAIPASPTVPTN
jgi:hypothetical protein